MTCSLHLQRLEGVVQLLKLVDLPDEEVSVPAVHLRVCDVDHVLIDVEINLKLTRKICKKTLLNLGRNAASVQNRPIKMRAPIGFKNAFNTKSDVVSPKASF